MDIEGELRVNSQGKVSGDLNKTGKRAEFSASCEVAQLTDIHIGSILESKGVTCP